MGSQKVSFRHTLLSQALPCNKAGSALMDQHHCPFHLNVRCCCQLPWIGFLGSSCYLQPRFQVFHFWYMRATWHSSLHPDNLWNLRNPYFFTYHHLPFNFIIIITIIINTSSWNSCQTCQSSSLSCCSNLCLVHFRHVTC